MAPQPDAPRRHRVLVLGGGPAGATAARLLAMWGVPVTLLTRARPAAQAIGESLPPSCGKLFRHLGIAEAMASRGFVRSTGNTVWWGGEEARVERFAPGAFGLQVSSHELEETLLALAEPAGVEIERQTVTRVETAEESGRTRGAVLARQNGRTISHEADWILDARGRASRLGERLEGDGSATLALGARWRSRAAGFGLPDPSHTLVESYEDGWAWSVPLDSETRFVACMIDPKTTALDPSRAPDALYAHELAKTGAMSRLLAEARQEGALVARDASTYCVRRFCGPGLMLAGDASSFIDPLSSFGVKKAMASGWLAAVCLHTCLTEPEMTPHAVELFESREREVYTSYARLSARYFERGSPAGPSPFWQDRAALSLEEEPEATDTLDTRTLRRDPDVVAALAALRQRESVRLRLAPEARLEPRPMVAGNRVVLGEHLVSPQLPSGVRYLRSVELPRLVGLATAGNEAQRVPDLYERYNREAAAIPLADFLGALAVSLGKGLLVLEESL